MPTPIIQVDYRPADTSATVLDLTPYVAGIKEGGIAGIHRRLSYASRETDFGIVSVVVWNGDGKFSRDHENFILGSGSYANKRTRVRMGWMLEGGVKIDPSNIFVGFLESILPDTAAKTAELKLTDALDRIKLTGVPPSKENELLDNRTPADVCLTMLGPDYANIPNEFIDIPSFTAADTSESGASIILRKFRIQKGVWFASFRIALTHGGTGLRVNRDGKITYFSYAPDSTTGDPSIVFPNASRIRGSYSSQTVRNATLAYKGDGSDPMDGTAPPTTGTPTELKKEKSIATFGERWQNNRELTFFNSQTPVDLVADRDLDNESRQPGDFKATIPFDETTYLIDLAQRVKFTSTDLGWDEKTLTVNDVDVRLEEMRLDLGLVDTDLDGDPYLYVNRSGHKVDDGEADLLMTAKGKLNVPVSPAETLVTLERLIGIQNAIGGTLIYGATLPGKQFTGTTTLNLSLAASRTPFIYVRFHLETIPEPPNSAFSRMEFREYDGFSQTNPMQAAKNINFRYNSSEDWVIVLRSWNGQGRIVNPNLDVDGDLYKDPLVLRLQFIMDTQNGTDFNSWVKNIVIGGCDTEDPPFLVTQQGVGVEQVTRTW